MSNTPAAGDTAPDFKADSTAGIIQRSDTLGHKMVLFFYPKDNTPGCTTEAQEFQAHQQDFERVGCYIAGVSRDSLNSHARFTEKLGLKYPLIADTDETVCQLYDVIRNKNMYGKIVRGIERSTFLIDAQGKIVRVWRGVKVPGHAKEVLEAAQAL
ncbi:MAG: peroxiredoxin [Burkholderiaceae bacterium]|nr:peroxiredoxin [Burkholderiaceae bacterium]MCD8538220.1 peroxiredoxin [Burkholderiaceae bacterium]MCD8565758.1 peroxiredoxin [Burkholderiaceae bacterium]